jgi:hypothetical protein
MGKRGVCGVRGVGTRRAVGAVPFTQRGFYCTRRLICGVCFTPCAGLWFDQAAEHRAARGGGGACRLFDYRFPGSAQYCCAASFLLGSVSHAR